MWPDDLEIGDRFLFDGDIYKVSGTGPGEATAHRVNDEDVTVKVGRYAITETVYIESERTVPQDEFGELVTYTASNSGKNE